MSFSFFIQPVEKVVLSTFCNLLHYVICSVPLMYLLGNTMGVQGTWIALVVANAITGIISIGLAPNERKRLKKLIG